MTSSASAFPARDDRAEPDPAGDTAALAVLLDVLPQAILLVNANATVRRANRAATALLRAGDGLLLSNQRLAATRPTDTAALHCVIAAAGGGTQRGNAVVTLRRPSERPPLALLVWALEKLQPAGPALVAVFVGDPDRPTAISEPLLRRLYGLTRAEARLAGFLADGHSLLEAAAHLGVGRATVRTHLQRILEKTGTNRQASLLRLFLTGLAHLHIDR